MTELLHDRENNELSENHLKDNGQMFNNQCLMVLRLLYRGGRWHAKQVSDALNITDGGRRLRNIFAARKDCKREWVKGSNGITRHVDYWLEIQKQETKESLQNWFRGFQEEKGERMFIQQDLFNH